MVLSGLEPDTTYQFSVLAQNKLGTGPFSEVVTVNTLGEYNLQELKSKPESGNETEQVSNWNTVGQSESRTNTFKCFTFYFPIK